MTLKNLYELGNDVRESEIPIYWRESFNEFIFGSACLVDTNEDGTIKEFIYYAYDFRRWYNLNRKEIDRFLKINNIIS